MTKQEGTGWAIIMVIIFVFLWLWKNWQTVFGGGQTAVVQSGIALPGGSQNTPTTTTYPTGGGCCG
jgi:hypothetical protein